MLQNRQREAIIQFASTVTVPLIHFESGGEIDIGKADSIASGTFFGLGDRIFLVTARHVIDDHAAQLFAFPTAPRAAELVSLGDVDILKPSDDQDFIDVAVLELTSEIAKRHARNGWRILQPHTFQSCPASGTFLFFGYPAATITKGANRLQATPIALFAETLASPPDAAQQPIYSNIDLFFDHPTTSIDTYGNVGETPNLKGMSGCSVWAIGDVDTDKFWTPARALKLVGVQSSALEKTFIRAKSWEWVETILNAFQKRGLT